MIGVGGNKLAQRICSSSSATCKGMHALGNWSDENSKRMEAKTQSGEFDGSDHRDGLGSEAVK
jgi:hypothetical protein